MRLNDHLLLQLVDDQLVFVDESIGAEVTLPATLETLLHIIDDVNIARIEQDPASVEIQGIRIPEAAFDQLLQGMGYLVQQATV